MPKPKFPQPKERIKTPKGFHKLEPLQRSAKFTKYVSKPQFPNSSGRKSKKKLKPLKKISMESYA